MSSVARYTIAAPTPATAPAHISRGIEAGRTRAAALTPRRRSSPKHTLDQTLTFGYAVRGGRS